MTCESLAPEQWRLRFPQLEADFLINVVARLGKYYAADLNKLSPALRAYWQGTLSRDENPGSAMDESQEVLAESRNELRAERLALVEKWLREYELAENRDPWEIELSLSERNDLVAMLNDRRMMLALEIRATESDMEIDPALIPDEGRRVGVYEIDVLGHFILVMLGPQIYRP